MPQVQPLPKNREKARVLQCFRSSSKHRDMCMKLGDISKLQVTYHENHMEKPSDLGAYETNSHW